MDVNDHQLIDTYAEANAVSGQMCQFSRALLQSNSLDTALAQAEKLLLNIGASGFIRLTCQVGSIRRFFNKGLSRRVLLNLQQLVNSELKITTSKGLLQLKTQYVYLVVDITQLKPYQQDIFVDHLAIFIDTLDAWLQLFEEKERDKRHHVEQNDQHASQIYQSITQLEIISDRLQVSFQQLVQELLCNFTKHFPTMALEHDQEELILAIAEHECDKHAMAITKQLTENKSLISLLNSTAQQLAYHPEHEKPVLTDGQSIELF